jgi:glycosyltransferase involved in cell wall biosynthesis
MTFSIDLCVPAYLAEEHLPRLLESASIQNPPFQNIIVCVDDSPDNSAEVARKYNATVIVNNSNQGCSASKNNALNIATSEWVHFSDADDELLPSFTSIARREAERQSSAEVILLAYEYRDFLSNELLAISRASIEDLKSDALRYCIRNVVPNFGIYKRDKLVETGGFDTDPSVLYNEDAAFHIKLALAGSVFGASSEVTSINWRHDQSMSAAQPVKCLHAQQAVMNNAAAQLDGRFSVDIAERLWSIASGFASHKEWKALREVLDDARAVYRDIPPGQSKLFLSLVKTFGPYYAFIIREAAIRLLKPHLRKSSS